MIQAIIGVNIKQRDQTENMRKYVLWRRLYLYFTNSSSMNIHWY